MRVTRQLAFLALGTTWSFAAAAAIRAVGTQPTVLTADGVSVSSVADLSFVYRTTPSGEATDDPKAPKLHHFEGATWMSAGDPAADVVVIFTPSTIEPSAILSFYSLFYEWEPSFHAVAIDQPGHLTGPYQTAGVACHSSGLPTCTYAELAGMTPDQADCSGAYLNGYLQFMHKAFGNIRQDGQKLVLAGISFGGILFEDYIRWRSHMGDDDATNGLILISNPTSEVWPNLFGLSANYNGGWLQETDVSWIPAYYTYNWICQTLISGGEIQAGSYISYNDRIPNLVEELHKEKDLEWRYHDSVDRNITGWKEEIFSLSAIANVPNETSAAIYQKSGLAMPSLRWSDHAMEVKQKLPKLILYAKYTNETDGTVFYAWAGLQEAVTADCTLAKNCTLEYAEATDWRRAVLNGWTYGIEQTVPPVLDPTFVPPTSPSEVLMWGHWVHVVSPVSMRAKVEEWIAMAPL